MEEVKAGQRSETTVSFLLSSMCAFIYSFRDVNISHLSEEFIPPIQRQSENG